MTSLSLEKLKTIYNETMAQADPRSAEYPLLTSPDKMLAMVGLYVFVVWQGPKWMASYKPWDLRTIIVIYNFAMVLMSTYISLGALYGLYMVGGYSVTCDNIKKYEGYHHTTIGWLFFISKLIEFLDTIFFILRKKNNQITFLHVYHHATMTVFTWVGVKFLPGGPNIVYPLINSFIHAVMYTYYGLAACGPSMQKYLWWKKYLTKMQITQFLIFLTQGVINAVYQCPLPKVFVYSVYFYTFTILLLFINFYVRAYTLGSRRSASDHTVTKNGSVAKNGSIAMNGEAVMNGNSKKVE